MRQIGQAKEMDCLLGDAHLAGASKGTLQQST